MIIWIIINIITSTYLYVIHIYVTYNIINVFLIVLWYQKSAEYIALNTFTQFLSSTYCLIKSFLRESIILTIFILTVSDK